MTRTVSSFREDTKLFHHDIRGQKIAYLDSAATTLKPQPVLDEVLSHYSFETANVHRGVHYLSELASKRFEEARGKVQQFIGAAHESEVIFTSGTTHAINVLARSLSLGLKPGDEILISEMEHHSNIVPWQLFCKEKGAILRKIPLLDSGDLNLDAYGKLLSSKTKVVAVTMVSNAIGTINPIKPMIAMAHEVGAKVVVDAAQAVSHLPIDVQDLNCDFLVFSGHKLYAPTGIGVLYGKRDLLANLPPAFGGGGMIRKVTIEESTYVEPPGRFEAGTPPIAQVIGLGAAIDYVAAIGFASLQEHENALEAYGEQELSKISGLHIVGRPQKRVATFSFVLEGIHPHDIGTLLDQEGVAVRTGHHCCQPLMSFYKVPATTRASLAAYNNKEDIDRLCAAIIKVQEMFK